MNPYSSIVKFGVVLEQAVPSTNGNKTVRWEEYSLRATPRLAGNVVFRRIDVSWIAFYTPFVNWKKDFRHIQEADFRKGRASMRRGRRNRTLSRVPDDNDEGREEINAPLYLHTRRLSARIRGRAHAPGGAALVSDTSCRPGAYYRLPG